MTQAVIRGKISSSGSNLSERLEDLLTSDVFGRLRYLESEEAIIPILERIKNSKTGQRFAGLEIDPNQKVTYQFWPWINNIEPDLILIVPLLRGKQMAVVVECKHKSGKSPRAVKDENITDKLELAKSDQLVREYLLVEELKKQYDKAILLYITGHSAIPDEEIKESASLAASISNQTRKIFFETTYWIGWVDIWSTLRDQLQALDANSQSAMIIEDTVNLLSHHGYREFQQFPGLNVEIATEQKPVWYDDALSNKQVNVLETQQQDKDVLENPTNKKQVNIKKAFSLVFDVYQEAAFLVKDLEKAVENRGFRPANKATGHKTGNSYDRPEEWLATFSCRYWVEDNRPGKLIKKGPKIQFLGCTAIYAIYGRAIEPIFTYGVLQGMNNPEAEFYHEWLLHVNQNEGGNYSFHRNAEGRDFAAPPPDRQPTVFQCRLSDSSYAWPKCGIIVAFPLTDIREPKDIYHLADEMRDLWQNRFEFMAIPRGE